jgi:hypothetical protein
MRNGQAGHLIAVHLRTSSRLPPQQSMQWARIASPRDIRWCPSASSSAIVMVRGSRPIGSPSSPAVKPVMLYRPRRQRGVLADRPRRPRDLATRTAAGHDMPALVCQPAIRPSPPSRGSRSPIDGTRAGNRAINSKNSGELSAKFFRRKSREIARVLPREVASIVEAGAPQSRFWARALRPAGSGGLPPSPGSLVWVGLWVDPRDGDESRGLPCVWADPVRSQLRDRPRNRGAEPDSRVRARRLDKSQMSAPAR